MKIKQEKKFTLPQLIEWAWDNKIKNQIIRADKQLMNIQFDVHGDFRTYGFTGIDTTFTIEVEEELTEDTVIPKLVTRNTSGGYNEWSNDCVNGFNLEYIEAIHISNDDLTLTLIWTNEKGLVE